jgi:hypothetical protein
MAESPTSVREAIGAAVAPYLVDGQEQDIGIADAVIDTLASLPLPVILDTLGYNVVLDGLLNGGPDGHWDVFPLAYGGFKTSTPCYVIAKKPPATDEAHDG